MNVIGIVAECNPLHRGHTDLIRRARDLTGASYCVILLSGDYVQRGAPACIDKYQRARALLENGADLIVELPLYTALSSARDFAGGSMALADRLGIITDVCFGSESGDTDTLIRTADALMAETQEFSELLKERLEQGDSYPKARAAAAEQSGIAVPSSPNDILGLEYITALKSCGSQIRVHALDRIAAASASDIRAQLTRECDCITSPPADLSMLSAFEDTYHGSPAVSEEDFSDLLLMRLFEEAAEAHDLSVYLDADASISSRIEKLLPEYTGFEDFAAKVKTRNYTYTRIARVLMHILLRMTKEEAALHAACGYVPYIHVLGVRKESFAALFNMLRASSDLPVVTGAAADGAKLSASAARLFAREQAASDLYEAVLWKKISRVTADTLGRQAAFKEVTRKFLTV